VIVFDDFVRLGVSFVPTLSDMKDKPHHLQLLILNLFQDMNDYLGRLGSGFHENHA
jgi:hypothetical protein